MTIIETNCRLCFGLESRTFFSIECSPSSVEGLLNTEELAEDKSISLTVVVCESCGFIQLPHSPLPKDFYRNYDKSAAHSAKMRNYQRDLALELDQQYSFTGKLVLEVGCGDGNFAQLMARKGATVTAVEPGATAAEMARSRGITVTEDYFGPSLFDNAKFDIIVTRQVLSHVEDLSGFVLATEKYLKSGGFFIVEVPNVEKAISERRYYDFFPDYVNYFSPNSLCRLMDTRNFELVQCSAHFDGEYTVAVFRKPTPVNFMADFGQFSNSLRKIVSAERRMGRRIACWGAGGRGVSLLAMCGFDQSDIAYLVDSSPDKQGLFTPGSKFKILPTSALKIDRVECVMITAIQFQDEILMSLKEDLQYSGNVILLAPQPRIVAF